MWTQLDYAKLQEREWICMMRLQRKTFKSQAITWAIIWHESTNVAVALIQILVVRLEDVGEELADG